MKSVLSRLKEITWLFRQRVLTIVAIVALIISTLSSAMAKEQLVLLTWEDYLDPEIVSEFEAQHNVSVRFVYYEDDDARDLIMANSNAQGFDLVLVDELAAAVYKRRNWLYEMTVSAMPNLKFIEQPVIAMPMPEKAFSVPYAWGTIGIIYRSDQFSKPIESWADYFEPGPELRSKMLSLNTAQTLFAVALKSLGYSGNSTATSELKAAADRLRSHKPFVSAYRNIKLNENSGLITGSLAAAMAYNGDAQVLMDLSDKLRYVVPDEGSVLWYDSWVVLQSSSQKRLAMKFLDFINQPDVNARNTQFKSYATPNKAAEKMLPEAFLSNPVIYPQADVMNKLELMALLPPKIMKRIHADYVSIVN